MLGNEALAARTYAVNIVTFSYVFAMSVGQGGGICIGHLIGKGHKNAALLLGRYCIRITLMISFSVALLSALLGKSVMGLLSDNPEVVSLTALILCIDVVLELGRAVNILCVNFLRATGDAVYPVHHRAYLHVGRGDRRRLRARRYARLRSRRDVDRLYDG